LFRKSLLPMLKSHVLEKTSMFETTGGATIE
jgi:hypothetical protein